MAVGLTHRTAVNVSDLRVENCPELLLKFFVTPVIINIANVALNLIVGDALKCINSRKYGLSSPFQDI
jgi:hypothetical protein